MVSRYNVDEYKFQRVEEFFKDYQKWERLENVKSCQFDEGTSTLALTFDTSDSTCAMLIHFLRKDIFRKRFNPGKKTAEDYGAEHSQSIMLDSVHHLRDHFEDFDLEYTRTDAGVELITSAGGISFMKMVVNFTPYRMAVWKFREDGDPVKVFSDAEKPVYFCRTRGDSQDFSIIQVNDKSPTAKYIGFGEKGSNSLTKNSTMLTYFNFDNMRYRQIYDQGPLNGREPLYHSDPFYMEFYGVPEHRSVYGIFIDNPSQTFIDTGHLNSKRTMFGSMFGDLDYYFFLGDRCSDITKAYTSVVGKSYLKPRYALGFHQGCYGYDTREKLINVANAYRQNGIPIDGLHIDVDIQHRYQTFTIYDEKYGEPNPPFPDPKGMFDYLRANGFKCSTNITPIISNKNIDGPVPYVTYKEGVEKGYLIMETRDPSSVREIQNYSSGHEYRYRGNSDDIHQGQPYVGEVWYGGDRGSTGSYADFARDEVQEWWGKQYTYLFETGLEMVWQDMTSPCIRDTRGDMRSLPFNLEVLNNFLKKYQSEADDDCNTQDHVATGKVHAIKIRNLFSYNLHKATYHGLNALKCRHNKRNFIVGRGGFSGMHRFAALWTGDNCSSWDFLQISVAQALTLGITGQAMSGQDIGGFEQAAEGGKWIDPELMIRWTVAGAFLPWFRNHYIAKGVKDFQEPFRFKDVIDQVPAEYRPMYEAVLPVCKYYISLRYRLMQLLYDQMFENSLTGMPIARAMILSEHLDDALYNDKIESLNNQFFIGHYLLIAPIMDKQAAENLYGRRDVYLPRHSYWYAFKDNVTPLDAAVEGGTTVIDFDASINLDPNHLRSILPMYVRAGAIIPTIELEQYVNESRDHGVFNPITLNIYPGKSGQYTMYLDDGVSRSSAPKIPEHLGGDPMANDEYREVHVSHTLVEQNKPGKPGQRKIVLDQRNYTNYDPVKELNDKFGGGFRNHYYLAVISDPSERKGANGPISTVTVAGQKINPILGPNPDHNSDALHRSSENNWYYNENTNISYIKVFDTAENIGIDITYEM